MGKERSKEIRRLQSGGLFGYLNPGGQI